MSWYVSILKVGIFMWVMGLINKGWSNMAGLIFGDLLETQIWQNFNCNVVLEVLQLELGIKDVNTKENMVLADR